MPLDDYQFSVQNLLLGPGTDYIVAAWDGYGSTEYRTSDDPAPLDHGVWTGPEYLSGRTVTLDVVVRGDSPDDAVTNAEALLAAWYLDTTADGYGTQTGLGVKLPGQVERVLYGRPRRARLQTGRIKGTNVPAALEFFAPDPRWYSASLNELVLNTTTSATGRGYNSPASGRQYDYGYGGGTSGAGVATNDGSMPTWPTFRVNGPVTNPYLENITTGEFLYITYTLGVGEWLDIDFKDKTVLLNGESSRYYTKSGTWWMLQPGDNNVRLGGTTTGSPSATVSWRDAWL